MEEQIYVIDLFCGIGGFSDGAKQAGAKVALAIDNWGIALEVHKNNHPETIHWNLTLGSDVSEFSSKIDKFIFENIPPSGHVHIHGSPPCQNLSQANIYRNEKQGIFLVDWYIDVVKNISRVSTWSMEQVRCAYTKKLIDIHGGCLVEMKKFGVHNDRKRVFIGNFNDFTQESNYSTPLTLLEVLDLCGESAPEGFDQQTAGAKFKNKEGYSSKDLNLVSNCVTSQFPTFYNNIFIP